MNTSKAFAPILRNGFKVFAARTALTAVSTFGFAYDEIPVNDQISLLTGFVTACCDVVAQGLGGKPGGNGSVNGAVKSFQLVISEEKI